MDIYCISVVVETELIMLVIFYINIFFNELCLLFTAYAYEYMIGIITFTSTVILRPSTTTRHFEFRRVIAICCRYPIMTNLCLQFVYILFHSKLRNKIRNYKIL